MKEKKNQAELKQEEFTKPAENTTNGKANYDAIGEDGLPIRGKRVAEGDVLIGKVIPIKNGADGVDKFRDVSHVVEVGNGGIVDEVCSSINGDGFVFYPFSSLVDRCFVGRAFNSRNNLAVSGAPSFFILRIASACSFFSRRNINVLQEILRSRCY